MIDANLKANENQKRITLTLVDAFTDLPDDFQMMRQLQAPINGFNTPLTFHTPDRLDMLYRTTGGGPRGYTLQGGQLEVRPAPTTQAPVDVEVTYYARVPTLVSNATNRVSQAYPNLYVAAMMIEANSYVQDTEEMNKWANKFNNEMIRANRSQSSYQQPSVG